jgi:hypothetical protein
VTGISFAEHFCGASKDLKRPNEVEDLGSRRREEYHPPRARWDWLFIIKIRARHRTNPSDWRTGLAVYSFHLLVASSCQLRLLTLVLSSVEEERGGIESTHLIHSGLSLVTRRSLAAPEVTAATEGGLQFS